MFWSLVPDELVGASQNLWDLGSRGERAGLRGQRGHRTQTRTCWTMKKMSYSSRRPRLQHGEVGGANRSVGPCGACASPHNTSTSHLAPLEHLCSRRYRLNADRNLRGTLPNARQEFLKAAGLPPGPPTGALPDFSLFCMFVTLKGFRRSPKGHF